MNKQKVAKILKIILMVFMVISAILFWVENILVFYFATNGWLDEPIEVEPGTQAWYLG